MLPVSPTELAHIQSDTADAVCDKDCVIQRKTTTPDGYGTNTETWSTISPRSLKAGMAQPTAGQLSNYAYVIGSLATWQLHVPVGTNIQTQDHVIIAGQTLIVQVELDPQSYQGLRTVLVSEVKQH